MKIVTPNCNIEYLGGRVTIPARHAVVLPDEAAIEIARAARKHAPKLKVRISGLGHYTRHYCGQDLEGRSLLVWRGHGVGDQVIVAGICGILKRRFPGATIDYWNDPRLHSILWQDIEDLPFEPCSEPIPFRERWRQYDYHLILDNMCEADREPDQPNTWDGMLGAAGVDPESVPAPEKRPIIPIHESDRLEAAKWLRERGIEDRRLVLWQIGSSTPIRSYHPNPTREAMQMLATALPDVHIIATGSWPNYRAYHPLAEGPNIWSCISWRLRGVFALAETAELVVSPDSLLGHVAAGVGTPCLGLWSSFHPNDRVRYYADHTAIYNAIECSPCRVHECGDQPPGCHLTMNNPDPDIGTYCRGLAEIPAAAVAEKAQEILDHGSQCSFRDRLERSA